MTEEPARHSRLLQSALPPVAPSPSAPFPGLPPVGGLGMRPREPFRECESLLFLGPVVSQVQQVSILVALRCVCGSGR